ncbi:MAG TPA: hypothetical protein VF855_10440 [Acidimicrobiales bacterium]
MTNLGSIVLGYGLVLGSMAAYAAWVVRRGRRLAAQVPDEDKPWT